MNIKSIFEKINNGKNQKKIFLNLIILLLFGVLLILISNISVLGDKKEESIKQTTATQLIKEESSYEKDLKNELTDTLSKISGAGHVNVMISFEGTEEEITATTINNSDRRTAEKDKEGGERTINERNNNQTIVLSSENGSQKPIIVRKVNPRINGIIVVAEGAADIIIRERLQTAVKTLLSIPAHKVSVVPMKINK